MARSQDDLFCFMACCSLRQETLLHIVSLSLLRSRVPAKQMPRYHPLQGVVILLGASYHRNFGRVDHLGLMSDITFTYLTNLKLHYFPATYKGRHEDQNQLWHASFDISKASRITLRNNAAAGSERIGFHIRGESCYVDNPWERWDANTAHTTLHGIHIGYEDGFPGCLKIAKFLSWKNWDYGVFGYPSSRVVVEDTVVVDSNIGNRRYLFVYNFDVVFPCRHQNFTCSCGYCRWYQQTFELRPNGV